MAMTSQADQDPQEALEIALLNPREIAIPNSHVCSVFIRGGTQYEIQVGDDAKHIPSTGTIATFTGLKNGPNAIHVKATASGQRTSFQSSFTVTPAIDTHITGGPVHEYALFVLESSFPERKQNEYKMDDKDRTVHQSVLQIGPMFGDHILQVRAVDNDGSRIRSPRHSCGRSLIRHARAL